MNTEEAFQKLKRLELQDFGKKRKFELKESEDRFNGTRYKNIRRIL